MYLRLQGPDGGIKFVKTGFNWPQLIVGFFVPLWRGDWSHFAMELVLTIFAATFTAGLAIPIVGIVFAFIYNKRYIKMLLAHGYQPVGSHDVQVLHQLGITVIDRQV